VTDAWEPARYRRFSDERREPFDELLAHCRAVPGGSVVDLGCGTGELTLDLHRFTHAATTTGIDRSASMLAEAQSRTVEGLAFLPGDLGIWEGPPVDLVFANASLHWVPDHRALLRRLRRGVAEGGQLAFAVPSAFAHPSHTVARAVAQTSPFQEALDGMLPGDQGDSVLDGSAYAETLFELGASEQWVSTRVFGHVMAESADVVEWVRGTLLTTVRARLDDELYEAYLDRYRQALMAVIGDRRPYFYAFPRVLAWACFP
jgi:trans-aconitate 2-methyltransferase